MMKKYFQIVLTVILTVLMCFSITSCDSDSDGDENAVSNPLVGSWQECDENGVLLDDATEFQVFHITFNSDGTGILWIVNRGKRVGSGTFEYTYKMKGSSGILSMRLSSNNSDVEDSIAFTLSKGILDMDGKYFKRM